MKIMVIILCIFPSGLFAQHISVDSLEQNGYHVRIYKRQPKPRMIIKHVHDTVFIPIVRIVLLRDTLFREQICYYRIQELQRKEKPEISDMQILHTLLIGNANTNGYGMHLGMMLSLGQRISFFIGGGMGYNSVTKLTHLDLAGQLVIRVW